MNPSLSRPPKAILFDLDNTLCNFIEAKWAACRAVTERLRCGAGEDLFEYFLRPVHGFEDHAHIDDYLRDRGIYAPALAEEAGNLFDSVKIDTITPYPGVRETLEIIYERGIHMAVVTDASRIQAEKRLAKCSLDHFFPVLVTPESSGTRKPDHTPFILALEQLAVTRNDTWLVGDSLRREIAPGNELGLVTIFARYGDWINKEFPGICPDYTLGKFRDLLNLPGLDSRI
ncbi:MAG: HAD hydrolase-like protein [Methanospirillum sp.]|nr:HAD hydrolase-like protein [Methanospirillum sp.]